MVVLREWIPSVLVSFPRHDKDFFKFLSLFYRERVGNQWIFPRIFVWMLLTSVYFLNKKGCQMQRQGNSLRRVINGFVGYVGSWIECVFECIFFGMILYAIERECLWMDGFDGGYKVSSIVVSVGAGNIP